VGFPLWGRDNPAMFFANRIACLFIYDNRY